MLGKLLHQILSTSSNKFGKQMDFFFFRIWKNELTLDCTASPGPEEAPAVRLDVLSPFYSMIEAKWSVSFIWLFN